MAIGVGCAERHLTSVEVREVIRDGLSSMALAGKSLLLIIPDHSRTAPVGQVFKEIHAAVGDKVRRLDVLIALGTHPPLSPAMINARVEISQEERTGRYAGVNFYNHCYHDPEELISLGVIPAKTIGELSGGLFQMDVDVTINRRVFDYDHVCIIGPVFPHEVVGFSGGNKYFFPGISGREIIDFFHWLGAVITNPRIIGTLDTPVRAVLDRAGALLHVNKHCFAMTVAGGGLAGLYFGTPEEAWRRAADLSGLLHIQYCDRPFHTVLSCAPTMYDDLWTGGKCMYKLEPVVADGGELIIYAPHISEVSVTHGREIESLGYHTRDYFLKQWDRFKDHPWGVIAHSTHVRGIGEYDPVRGERCRIRVTLATGISAERCEKISLGYRDPASISVEEYQNREAEGVLYVKKAGEMLYCLKNPPSWPC